MSSARIHANEPQKSIEPARQPEREPARQHGEGSLQLMAPQAAYCRAQISGNRLTSTDILVMQRTVGNRQGQRMLAQMKADPVTGELVSSADNSSEQSVSLAEDTEASAAIVQLKMEGRIIQEHAAQGLIQRQPKDKKNWIPVKIPVKQRMAQEEFKVAVMRQVFAAVREGLKWYNLEDEYLPEKSPYTIWVEPELLKAERGRASEERGINVGEGGGTTGAKERAKTFHAGPATDLKSALMKEIDRRYFEAVGAKTETKIKPGEKGKAELWRMIRDEVLFQHEYIANLPPNVKLLIKHSITGKVLTPSDYDQLFRIAKKIEAMPPRQATDYASKVTGTTTDLNQFEASLESYSAEMAERQKGTEAHRDTMTKLAGLGQVYEKYKTWVTHEIIAPGANQAEQAELEKLLKAHDFAGIPEFKQYIDKFLKGFETESAAITQDLLAKYDGRLYREGERYKNPQEVSALHGKLGGYRSNLDVMKQSEDIMQAEYAKQHDERERSQLPGHGGTTPEPTEAFKAARKKGEGAKEAAKGELRNLAAEHPIFQDDEALPAGRRIDKIALYTATETSLQGVLLGFIAQRKDAVKDARGELAGNSELIWKMDKMIPQFMLQQGIVDGSIHAQIIQDKMREDRIKKIVIGILAAITAIALTVVSLGTATPAIVAAGAAAGAFGISAYMAYEDVKNYAQEKKLADAGLVDDPSIIWVVVAIAGAALDAGAAVKAIRAIGPLARAVNTGGDLVTFNKAVRALEEVGEIDAKIARAAERAAAAKKGYQEASSELVDAFRGKAYGGLGPLADNDVYRALVKMAAAKFKEIGNNGLIFIEEIKKARALAKLGEMTPEELAKVKQAWEEGKALAAAENVRYEKLLKQIPDATKLDALIAKAGDAAKLERLLQVFPETELEKIFAQLKDTGRLSVMLDHVGPETSAGMIRQWMAKGKFDTMNQFMERLAGGVGKELAETAPLHGKSVIIDSNTAIALEMDANPALRVKMNDAHKASVAYVKSLPAGTELRVGNATIGEVGSGVINVKGVPIEMARESAEYQKALKVLADGKVGKSADQGLIADAFFAKTEPGVSRAFHTSDKDAVKKLAGLATPKIDVNKIGGYLGLVKEYGPGGAKSVGFTVTIEGRTLTVIPIPLP